MESAGAVRSGFDAALGGADGDGLAAAVKPFWTAARAGLAARREACPGHGLRHAGELATATDALLGALWARARPGGGVGLLALGGYGGGRLAPGSDLDLLFVVDGRARARAEAAIGAMLRALWDLGLKVGHAVRTPGEVVMHAKADLSARTAMLGARWLAGDAALTADAVSRFRREVAGGTATRFIADKLAERRARHEKFGGSRYLVEPNVKEGKGALRDLSTLRWIADYGWGARGERVFVALGLLTAAEAAEFARADAFFWSVRTSLHDLAGRPEERLTFDLQPALARRLGYAERAGATSVERFMRHYYLHARAVGAVTGAFLGSLEEQLGNRGWDIRITRRPKHLEGFALKRGRVSAPSDGFFAEDPVRLLALWRVRDVHALDIDVATLRAARRDARLIGEAVRNDRVANALFLDVLTSPRDPETVLRQMGETGVLGRFLPDFGRVTALSQFNMYHHYTVDEHLIRAVGLLARVERGALALEMPLATRLSGEISARRALRVAVLLHDAAKGRAGDHSVLGAEMVERVGPRLGLDAAEVETAAWLVRQHLVMSDTAFRRDLADPATVDGFAALAGSPERLRLLAVLTCVDIAAVGPGVFTPWKAQLLEALFEAADERLRLGHRARGREAEVAGKQARLAMALGWRAERMAAHAGRFDDAYWVAEDADTLEANARLMAAVDGAAGGFGADCAVDATRGVTRVALYAEDAPGLFARAAGAIAMAGASIADARVHTTRDGRALDNFFVTAAGGGSFGEARQLRRLDAALARVVGEGALVSGVAGRPPALPRAGAFGGAAAVYANTRASSRFTVVEVNALDRPGLVHALACALTGAGAVIRSAHIATYGERAVDVFYLTGADGRKIEDPAMLARVEAALRGAAAVG